MKVIYRPDVAIVTRVPKPKVFYVPGIPGPPGLGSGTNTIDVSAGQAIGGHRAVAVGGVYADQSSTPEVLGISTAAYSAGQLMALRDSGLISEPGWTWSVNQPIYLGNTGALTQAAPASGYVVELGVATSATQMRISIQPPIFME
jgi:hypothetical protein